MPSSLQRPSRALPSALAALVTLLLTLSLAGAVLIGVNYGRRLEAVRESVATQRALTRLLSAVQDAETGQRGYLLTGRAIYLGPYDDARRRLPVLIDRARARVAAEPLQVPRVDRLRTEIGAKLGELEATVRLARAGDRAGALRLVATDQGRRRMDGIRRTLAELDRAVAEQERVRQRAATRLGWALLALMLVPLLAIPVLLVRAGRDVRALFSRASERLEARRAETERLGLEVADRDRRLGGLQDQFALVLDAATDYAIVLTDPDGVVTRWSRGAETVFGWDAGYAEGRNAEFFFTPEDREAGRVETEMECARDTGRAADERWHMRAGGTRFWASGELQPLRSPEGALLGYLKIVRDRTAERLEAEADRERAERLAERVDAQAGELEVARTEQEEAQGQLRQLQKLEGLGQLTAGIAHDFNNMLAVVIGALDLIRRKHASGDHGLSRLVAAAEDGANRAAELTKRLLAFSRQQPLQPEVLDVNRLVGGMSELLRRTLGEQVRIETVLAGGLWRVHADPHEIERVLVNLGVNARDAMPDGGRLTIETSNAHLDDAYAAQHPEVRAGQYVAICVTDTGTGMDAGTLERAFDPFFSTKEVGRGTGLGLSQLYGFAKQSAGHVKIYSELGHGTTVKLYLPRWFGADRPTLPRAAEPAPAVLPRGRPGEIVLVVEDEERVRHISVESLRELGYTVRHAGGPDEALRLLDALPGVTLLFTDIVMPGMTGRQLADLAQAKDPELKVLFTTGYTRNAVVHGGVLDAGVAFLPKPFTADQLAAKVRATIDGRGANR